MTPHEYFTNLVLAAAVDGELADSELVLLEQHAANLRLTSAEAQQIVDGVFAGELTRFTKPKSGEARKAAFKAIVRILRADRKITAREQTMIEVLGKEFELSAELVQGALSPRWRAD